MVGWSRRNLIKIAGVSIGSTGLIGTVRGRSQATNSEWPMFGYGPANSAQSPAEAPKSGISLEWEFETDAPVVSSPAVVDGAVYIGSDDGHIYALNGGDGTEKWRFKTEGRVQSSPAVIDGSIYVGSNDKTLYALDAERGESRWTFDTGDTIVSSPSVVADTVYVGSYDNSMYALNTANGNQRWSVNTDGIITSSPAVASGTVYFGSADNKVYAINASSGEQVWTFQTENGVSSSPAVVGDTLYIGSSDGNVYALNTETGKQKWAFATNGLAGPSPAVADGRVFVSEGFSGNKIHALDVDSGERIWTGAANASIRSSPAVANGTVYVGSSDGSLYAINAKEGTPIWRFRTGSQIRSSPALTDGAVYAASGSTIFAVTGNPTYSPTPTATETPSSTSTKSLEDDTTSRTSTRTISSTTTLSESPTPSLTRTNSSTLVPGGGETSRDDIDPLPIIVGILGLGGGGGAWLLHKYRDSISSIRGTGGGNVNVDEEEETHRDGDKDRGLNDDRSQGSTTSTNVGQRQSGEPSSGVFDEMVPEEIPGAPDVSVSYADLTDETHIGSGGNADVSRARLSTADGEVTIAVKTPRLSETLDADDVEQILTEAETWDQLDDHDHIVGIIDYAGDPLPWIAMEYMDGGDLSQHVGTMDTRQAVWTALGVTKAVHHAHRRGVAHLDLKPENILFRTVEGAWDVPKVADWGLSKHLLSHSKTVEGFSPHYAAPEQFDESYGPTDDITDVYQLGAVFYELFTGEVPFDGPPTKVMRAVLDEPVTPPSDVADVPAGVDEILLTALAKEREERYDSLVYLRDALEDWLLSRL